MKKDDVISTKSFEFSIRIVKLYKYLIDDKNERVMSKQLLRSGTSIGANISESKYAASKSDFVNKMSIALKEAAETEYWLLLLNKTDYLSGNEFVSINTDCEELIKLLAASIKTRKDENKNPQFFVFSFKFLVCRYRVVA